MLSQWKRPRAMASCGRSTVREIKSPAHRTGRQKGDGRVITNHQYKHNTKFDYESILRHRKRRGLLPDLLVELGLCDLCQVRRGRGI